MMKPFNLFSNKSSVAKMLLAAALLVPTTAMAHSGHSHEMSGFMSGLAHPVGGLDHLLAMVAVGIWAAFMGGKAQWGVPAAFVVTMLLGGLLAVSGVAVPFVEGGIVLSVIAMGALLAFAVKFHPAVCAALVAGFALFHGAAHGTEMPLEASGLAYGAGFALATAVLHGAGFALSKLCMEFKAELAARVAGGAIAVTGLAMVAA